MTSDQSSYMPHIRRHFGLAWLAFWVLIGGTLGYRALTHEMPNEAVASVAADGKVVPNICFR